ncbi:hypothetical protein AB0B88_16395 [Micromonospora haikouensis]|uniref:hypothetical protein n=1 Tax=Actinomycetes TaxID=1760 RepID=UPI0033C32AAD
MSKRFERSGLRVPEQQEAARRLTERFAPWSPIPLSDGEVVHKVGMAVDPEIRTRDDVPQVTAEDALDALGLAGPAMFQLEVAELETMAYARHVLRIEWEPIGLRLGYAPGAAKQGAAARYARLAARYPWAVERIKQQVTPTLMPVEQEGGEE